MIITPSTGPGIARIDRIVGRVLSDTVVDAVDDLRRLRDVMEDAAAAGEQRKELCVQTALAALRPICAYLDAVTMQPSSRIAA